MTLRRNESMLRSKQGCALKRLWIAPIDAIRSLSNAIQLHWLKRKQPLDFRESTRSQNHLFECIGMRSFKHNQRKGMRDLRSPWEWIDLHYSGHHLDLLLAALRGRSIGSRVGLQRRWQNQRRGTPLSQRAPAQRVASQWDETCDCHSP
eukprot:3487032-Pleurochrysis_carterae.AAC.4